MPSPIRPRPVDAVRLGGFSRRDFLKGLAAGGAAVVAVTLLPRRQARGATTTIWSVQNGSWTAPSTWNLGRVPGPADVAQIGHVVTLAGAASVAGAEILAGGILQLRARQNASLTSTGNVIVRGVLRSKPATTATHSIVFAGIDESQFVGGGMEPLDTDVGLWVMDAGVLDLAGPNRLAWTRATGGVGLGKDTVKLQEAPAGWKVGDTVVLTPTKAGDLTGFDYATIAAVDGSTITLSGPTSFAHPKVTVAPGIVYTTEVLNVTRNIRVEGTASGRSHVFVHSTAPQTVRQVALRHLGPRQGPPGQSDSVLGRYALHFHMCGDLDGTAVEGTVARDLGSHAFVPHMSDNVAFDGCISLESFDEALWWDHGTMTNGTTVDRCVVAGVHHDPEWVGIRTAGFQLGPGEGNRVTDSVAVGVMGHKHSSGFSWPEDDDGLWTFTGNVAHNNFANGVFTWQANPLDNSLTDSVLYHNGKAGIEHGSYLNLFSFRDLVLYGSGIYLHAGSGDPQGPPADHPLEFVRLTVDCAGLAPHGLESYETPIPAVAPVEVRECTFDRYTGSLVKIDDGGGERKLIDFIRCLARGVDLQPSDFDIVSMNPDSVVRVVRTDGTNFEISGGRIPPSAPVLGTG